MPRVPPSVSPPPVRVPREAPAEPAAAPAVEPRPQAADAYEAHFDRRGNFPTRAAVDGLGSVQIAVSPNGRDPSFVAEAGKPLTVVVPPEMVDRSGVKKVELCWRMAHEREDRRVLISDGSRDLRSGALVCLPATFEVPADASGVVRLSLEVTGADGKTSRQWSPHYDAVVMPKVGATLTFDEGWGEHVEGTVRGGERLALAYDVDRLRGELGDGARVTAFVAFGDDPPLELPISLDGRDDAAFMPAVRVPFAAQQVKVWFRAEHEGQTSYDSAFGKNYSFDVALPQPDADPAWKEQALRLSGLQNLREDNFVGVGPGDDSYNCIAWSLGRREGWVWPGTRVADFDKLYGEQGYRPLDDVDLAHEPGVEKIALYATRYSYGELEVTHAARNDEDGRWLSKLGTEPLIRHEDPHAVAGQSYGEIVRVYARPRPGAPS